MTYSTPRSEYLSRLKDAVKTLHGIESEHVGTSKVTALWEGRIAWTGEVETYRLNGHPTAALCYAWGYEDDGELKITAVLGISPIDSPSCAVDVAIAAKGKNLQT